MATAKICTSGILDAVKPEEGKDSCDTFIKHAIEKKPLHRFTRAGTNPVQWVQFLHALDQPDLSGLTLLTPVKVQIQKCEKCSLEFCSPINYRRHIRVHRKSFNVNKDTRKNRDLLSAFWDKISLEQAREVVSFDKLMLKEIPGSSIIEALASSVGISWIWALPPHYVQAANALLDIIAGQSVPPQISSQELFSILDDASERTFLCGGTADSVQKYVFDGEVSRNCLELKNAIACTSFLFEQQLVKVWTDDKDAEALRCQILLVEEEEAAQKRQSNLLEKKRQKKLRKEQKLKEQDYGNMDVNANGVDMSASSSNPPDIPTSQDSPLEPTQPQIKQSNEEDIETQPNIPNEHIKQSDDSRTINRWQAPFKPKSGSRFRFNPQPLKFEPTMNKPATSKDPSLQNGTKIWTKKHKIDTERENQKPPLPSADHHMEENSCEVMIGSISVTLKNSVSKQQDKIPEKKNASERSTKAEEQSKSTDCFDNLKGDPFSSAAAKTFLDRRYKEALASDHVRLVLSEPESLGSSDVVQFASSTLSSNASDPLEKNIKVEVSKKLEKSVKVEYIPKQKAAA